MTYEEFRRDAASFYQKYKEAETEYTVSQVEQYYQNRLKNCVREDIPSSRLSDMVFSDKASEEINRRLLDAKPLKITEKDVTLDRYHYEKAMLECLDATFQKFLEEKAYCEKHGSSDPRMQGYVDKRMDEAIAQKELVEAVIGECINLQKDGHIRIGVEDPIDYEAYLEGVLASIEEEKERRDWGEDYE